MVSANSRIAKKADINGRSTRSANGLESQSVSTSISRNSSEANLRSVTATASGTGVQVPAQGRQQIEMNCLELQQCLHQSYALDPHSRDLYVGLSSGDGRRLCLGAAQQPVQRRSVTKDLTVVANGLKPIRGSANKFSVNQIDEKSADTNDLIIDCNQCDESVIEFTTRKPESASLMAGQYPISSDCNIIATTKDSQLYIKDNSRLIAIRPKDGFVLIHTNLTVINKESVVTTAPEPMSSRLKRSVGQSKHFYSSEDTGHLFVVAKGVHLLVLDKTSRNECVLVVGVGGLDVYSLSDNNVNTGHKCFNISCVDRTITLFGAELRAPLMNSSAIEETKRCQQIGNKSKTIDSKRQLNESNEEKLKRQKCNHWPPIGNSFYGQTS